MRIKFTILIISLFISFVSGEVLGSDCVISKLTGKVEVFKQEKWFPVEVGFKLKQNDKLKTYSTGRAELTFADNSTIWIKENTELNIATLFPEDRSVEVKTGQVRTKVTPLKPGHKFTLKTPTAVAAVRGTEFILIIGETCQLLVVSGKMEFTNIVSDIKSEVVEGQTVFSHQSGELTPPRDFSLQEVNVINDDSWKKFAPVEPAREEKTEQQREIKEELVKLRQELRELIHEVKTDLITARERIDEIRETDISTGRTLRDHFGNLVRIEQYLLRPDAQTIQILNLTKRQEYTYKGYFSAPFTQSARIDSFDARLRFNLAMPDDLADWPSFMMNKGKELKPKYMRIELSNGKDYMITEAIYFEEKKDWDSTIKYISGKPQSEGGGEWLVDADYEPPEICTVYNKDGTRSDKYNGVVKGGEDSLWLWGISPQMRLYRNSEVKFVYLGTEFYGINNSGNILSIKDFTGFGANPFAVLKEVAFQNVLFCKTGKLYYEIYTDDYSTDLPEKNKLQILNDFKGLDDFFAGKNIDLVATPDLFIPTAQKLITQIDKLKLSSTQN